MAHLDICRRDGTVKARRAVDVERNDKAQYAQFEIEGVIDRYLASARAALAYTIRTELC
jgi:hypothetical protein